MDSELARLRAKTDRDLGVLIARQLHRSRRLAARGDFTDAASDFLAARALLEVADIPPAERARLERLLTEVRTKVELPMGAVA
jgi:hypothetical protein